MDCPKCGWGKMNGPRYVKKAQGGLPETFTESLTYTCTRCGFVHSEACRDDPKTEDKKYLREG